MRKISTAASTIREPSVRSYIYIYYLYIGKQTVDINFTYRRVRILTRIYIYIYTRSRSFSLPLMQTSYFIIQYRDQSYTATPRFKEPLRSFFARARIPVVYVRGARFITQLGKLIQSTSRDFSSAASQLHNITAVWLQCVLTFSRSSSSPRSPTRICDLWIDRTTVYCSYPHGYKYNIHLQCDLYTPAIQRE